MSKRKNLWSRFDVEEIKMGAATNTQDKRFKRTFSDTLNNCKVEINIPLVHSNRFLLNM